MIVLLGGSGFLGQAFTRQLQQRGLPFLAPSRHALDYTCFKTLFDYLKKSKPTFLINAAGYTGKPNVDACETARDATLLGNTLFPLTLAHTCSLLDLPWAHLSSGCIYSGAKTLQNGQIRVEKDLTRPDLQELSRTQPQTLQGYSETDPPNFSFDQPPSSFYSGTKALAEIALANSPHTYIWRLRIPFDEQDHPRNYLSKVQQYPKVYDNINSLSHRSDFVNACLDLWQLHAPFGTYNVTNPGFVSTRQVVELIQKILHPTRTFAFWNNDEEFYRLAAKTPRSNCILDVSKLLSTGVKMRPVEDALVDALKQWRLSPPTP